MRSGKRWLIVAFWAMFLAGCHEPLPTDEASPSTELGKHFDAADTATLRARVVWEGPLPQVPDFDVYTSPDSQPDSPPPGPRPNPHVPRIDPTSGGVRDAVFFLRRVDLARSRPWHHPAVTVVHRDWSAHIEQGDVVSPVGFVRRGDVVTTVSRQKILHILRGEGASLFSLPLLDPDLPSRKRLARHGVIELSSGAGYYWLRSHLFVDDHPYYARSDQTGRGELAQVPAGTYQVVCWLPNWHIARQERDPESSQIGRVMFAKPIELEQTVTLSAGSDSEVSFTLSASVFSPQGR